MGISWADRVISEVLYIVKEKRNILTRLNEIKLPGYMMRRNYFLKHVIEGMIEGTRRRGRSRKQLLGDLKKTRRYHDDIVCYIVCYILCYIVCYVVCGVLCSMLCSVLYSELYSVLYSVLHSVLYSVI